MKISSLLSVVKNSDVDKMKRDSWELASRYTQVLKQTRKKKFMRSKDARLCRETY